jgi:hypothetical protein
MRRYGNDWSIAATSPRPWTVRRAGPACGRDDALWKEKVRESAIRRYGWSVERVIWADVSSDWDRTSRRLRPYLRAFPSGAANFGTEI